MVPIGLPLGFHEGDDQAGKACAGTIQGVHQNVKMSKGPSRARLDLFLTP